MGVVVHIVPPLPYAPCLTGLVNHPPCYPQCHMVCVCVLGVEDNKVIVYLTNSGLSLMSTAHHYAQ